MMNVKERCRGFRTKMAVLAAAAAVSMALGMPGSVSQAEELTVTGSEEVAVVIGSGGATSGENTESSAEGSENTDAAAEGAEGGESAEAESTGGTASEVTVTAGSARVRSEASTSSSVAGSASSGTVMTVTSETQGDDGNLWYGVSYEDGGETITGYIRSDLVEVTQTAAPEVPEETTPETAPAETTDQVNTSDEYYVQYADDGTGNSTWYLVDNAMGTRYKVSDLLSAQSINEDNQAAMDSQSSSLRIVIIVLAVIIVLLIAVVTFMIIKMRNSYDDDYDDDDDEDDDEDDEDDDEDEEDEDDEDEDDEEYYRPRRSRVRPARRPVRQSRYEDDDEDDEDEEEDEMPRRSRGRRPETRREAPASRSKNWQAKNFMDEDDDDDMDFEFLDLK